MANALAVETNNVITDVTNVRVRTNTSATPSPILSLKQTIHIIKLHKLAPELIIQVALPRLIINQVLLHQAINMEALDRIIQALLLQAISMEAQDRIILLLRLLEAQAMIHIINLCKLHQVLSIRLRHLSTVLDSLPHKVLNHTAHQVDRLIILGVHQILDQDPTGLQRNRLTKTQVLFRLNNRVVEMTYHH